MIVSFLRHRFMFQDAERKIFSLTQWRRVWILRRISTNKILLMFFPSSSRRFYDITCTEFWAKLVIIGYCISQVRTSSLKSCLGWCNDFQVERNRYRKSHINCFCVAYKLTFDDDCFRVIFNSYGWFTFLHRILFCCQNINYVA